MQRVFSRSTQQSLQVLLSAIQTWQNQVCLLIRHEHAFINLLQRCIAQVCQMSSADASPAMCMTCKCICDVCSCCADGDPSTDSRELAEALQRVQEQLHSTQSSAAVCLICLENMHHDDAVWHCYRGCCCILHLVCIQAWSRQQIAAATYSASAAEPSRCFAVPASLSIRPSPDSMLL